MDTFKGNGVVYSPRELDQWDLLVDKTAGILPVDGLGESPTIDHAEKLLETISELDNETLERARLRGLGYPLIYLTKVLMEPESRDEIIEDSSELLVAYHLERGGDDNYAGLHIMDIEGSQFAAPFKEHTLLNRHRVPSEISFLTDCLQYASLYRRAQRKNKQCTALPDLDKDMSWLGLSASWAGQLAPQAASSLFRAIFLRDASRLVGLNYFETALLNPLMLNVYTPSEIRDMNLLSTARGVSKLRLDEIRNTLRLLRFVTPNVDGISGNFGFNADLFKRPPPAMCDEAEVEDIHMMMLHESRIGCPARFVKFLFELILETMPEIYFRADQLIKEWPNQ